MTTNFSQTAAYIWSLADLLRGDFKQSQAGAHRRGHGLSKDKPVRASPGIAAYWPAVTIFPRTLSLSPSVERSDSR